MKYANFDNILHEREARIVIRKFLKNRKAGNYKQLVDESLKNYKDFRPTQALIIPMQANLTSYIKDYRGKFTFDP